MNTLWTWLLSVLIGLSVLPVLAAEVCPGNAMRTHPPTVNFRVDNDLFGGAKQDQGYTNGAVLTLVSPNLADYTHDPCLHLHAGSTSTWSACIQVSSSSRT